MEEIQISRSTAAAQPCRPWVVLAMGVLTLGSYSWSGITKVNREMRDFGFARGDRRLAESKPARHSLSVTIGGFLALPEIISLIGTVRRLQATERIAAGMCRLGAAPVVAAVIVSLATVVDGLELLVLPSLSAYLTAVALVRARLNAAWASAARAAPLGSGRSQTTAA